MTPEQLRDLVRSAVAGAVERGTLAVAVPDDVVIERPRNPEHGDYATTVAMRLAKAAGRPPREVAELLDNVVDAVLDSGDQGKEPTTVIDLSGPEPEVIRQGPGEERVWRW